MSTLGSCDRHAQCSPVTHGHVTGLNASKEDSTLVKGLFESVGLAFELDEKLLDAVTGLSGSGPGVVWGVGPRLERVLLRHWNSLLTGTDTFNGYCPEGWVPDP